VSSTEPLRRDHALPVLHPGDEGPAVVELKRRLRLWYRSRQQRAPRRMRGPVYGASAVNAVLEFQRASGIEPTGVVALETWAALPE
jgi:peptidoglycan hydrolase-like protein with peptidoglycan-binding domain